MRAVGTNGRVQEEPFIHDEHLSVGLQSVQAWGEVILGIETQYQTTLCPPPPFLSGHFILRNFLLLLHNLK